MKTLLVTLGLALSINSSALTLQSQDISEGTPMKHTFSFNGFGCTGDNISPALNWHDAPKGTQSFAITAYDPDAPTESGFWHWVVLDIPASVSQLVRGASGQVKHAKEKTNDYGAKGFGGPCPPQGHGMHRYQFTIWALPTKTLEVPENASNAVIGFMLNAKSLAKARLTSTFVNPAN
ncbi:MAG: YbhB/YbcL family Raf kinase inhibitor-like protein [Oceanospirillaceae bacterium]|nr:YbhB/YbcL family Raf kinase inhibitor-like protein [Oceanospirillaceae bacterium]